MTSTVRTRPSHYEALGLTPAATSEEIARAFARETGPFQPRPLGGIAQVISAYEVLRDPIKRRAYDASLGLSAGSSPTAALLRGWAETTGSAPPPERTPGPVYGAARREWTGPPPQAAAKPDLEQSIEEFVAMHRSAAGGALEFGQPSIEWKRPWLAIGGLFLAVGLLGAVAGSWAANDIEPQPGEAEALLGPAPAEARPTASVAPPPAPRVAEPAPERPPTATPAAPARIARAVPPPQPELDEEPQAETTPSGQSRVEDIAAALTVAETPPSAAAAAAATLPLPNKVVARTIERIGYACGEVASTIPVEGGASGVFKVTCTSGQSYQARPVGGRYRFRRWGRD